MRARRARARARTERSGGLERGFYLGVGAQRSGTTWLAEYLFAHPQVMTNPVKEMHILNRWFSPGTGKIVVERHERLTAKAERRLATTGGSDAPGSDGRLEAELLARQELLAMVRAKNARASLAQYQSYFDRRRQDGEAFGEVTPAYALVDRTGWQRVIELFPSCQLFYCLRDPVDRLWSAVKRDPRIDVALDDETRLRRGLAMPMMAERSRYERTLHTLDAAVHPDRVHLLFYEDLFGAAHDETLKGLTDFLHLDFVPGRPDRRAAASPAGPPPSGGTAAAARELRATYAAVAERMGRLPERWSENRALAEG